LRTRRRELQSELRKINIHNAHPRLKIKKTPLRQLVKYILCSESASQGVDVILVDDNLMRRLNRQFTRRQGTTDVLSFGMGEGKSGPVEYPSLGDVYVSLDQAQRQAQACKADLDQEVALLVAHGVLHLLGYDHQERGKKAIMRKREREYLKSIGQVPTPG
jgi:probable rRNA maturation factor